MNTEQKLYDDNGEELPNRINYYFTVTYDVAEVMQSLRDTGQEYICDAELYALVADMASEDTGHKARDLTATYIFTDREETE
jgi:hypothetical protein